MAYDSETAAADHHRHTPAMPASSITERIANLERTVQGCESSLCANPPTVREWDNLTRRVSALEDVLLAPDNQPTADDLAHSVIRAEYDAWQRVNPGADVVEWTIHYARTRGLGVAA